MRVLLGCLGGLIRKKDKWGVLEGVLMGCVATCFCFSKLFNSAVTADFLATNAASSTSSFCL